MLDPFTAVSLVSAIVQFIDFGATLINKGREIRRDGSLVDVEELETVTKDLSQLAKTIKVQSNSTSGSASSIGRDEQVSPLLVAVAMFLLTKPDSGTSWDCPWLRCYRM